MEQFEEMFKTKAQDSAENRQRLQRFVEQKKNKRGITIIDTNRARNLCEFFSFLNLACSKSNLL